YIQPGFFGTLGVGAEAGRLPTDDELGYGGDNHVVVLSHGFWQRQFGGARATVGSTITLNGSPYRVLGVMPDAFRFPSPRVDAFVPYAVIPETAIPRVRGVRILGVV